MFTTLVVIVHLIVCVIMVLIILLQSGKGADIGAVFGGGSSQTVFGSSGATPFLSKVTIGAAVTFMVTSIVLSYFSGQAVPVAKSIMTEQPVKEAPATPGQPAPKESPAPATAGEAPATPKAEQTPAASPSAPEAPAPAKPAASAPEQPAAPPAPAAPTTPSSGSTEAAPPGAGSGTE